MPSAGIRKNRWSRFGGNNWEFHLRCVLDIQVKRSFIAAGYMSLEFKRGDKLKGERGDRKACVSLGGLGQTYLEQE